MYMAKYGMVFLGYVDKGIYKLFDNNDIAVKTILKLGLKRLKPN